MSILLNDAGRSQAELRRLAAAAWQLTKSEGGPSFGACTLDYQERLTAQVVDALNSGDQSDFALAVRIADAPLEAQPPEPAADVAAEPEPIADSTPGPDEIKPKPKRKLPGR